MTDSTAHETDEPSVGVLLFIPYRALEARVFGELAEAGFDDFTPAQARVMQRIGAEGSRLTELAEAAQVSKQTASFLIRELERSGYVRRTPDPSDARAQLIHVADRGRAAQPVAAEIVARVEAEWRAHLGQRRWNQLRTALTQLREITDPYQ